MYTMQLCELMPEGLLQSCLPWHPMHVCFHGVTLPLTAWAARGQRAPGPEPDSSTQPSTILAAGLELLSKCVGVHEAHGGGSGGHSGLKATCSLKALSSAVSSVSGGDLSPGLGGTHRGRQGGLEGIICLVLTTLPGLLGLPVEEQVNHHVPRLSWGDRTTHLQHHAGQQVVQDTNSVLALVVSRNGNVHVVHWRIGVAECNGGDVHVGRLLNGLVVSPGVSQDQQARLLEVLLDLVSKGTRGVATSQRLAAQVLCKLEHSALAVGAS
mmetsp:Transcript_19876/g.43255  ORF Transcript_19876/g.43255 Transcript_19876/m.43255 type:complete len:268 (-) Transcript_19876:308-1111(-)